MTLANGLKQQPFLEWQLRSEGFLALLHFHFPEPSSCEVLKFDGNNLILRGDRIKMKCEPERESSKSTQSSIFTL